MPHRSPGGPVRSFLLTAAALTLTAGALVAGTAGPASATNRVNVCGSGYGFVKSWPIKGLSWGYEPGRTVGYIDVYWSRSASKNCAVARPVNGLYNPHGIQVRIQRSNSTAIDMDGYGRGENFTKLAGPVYVYARNACINLSGGFSYNTGSGYTGWGDYMNVHCG
ncbi:hypothetical protein [Streptomyces sp. NPDC055607]